MKNASASLAHGFGASRVSQAAVSLLAAGLLNLAHAQVGYFGGATPRPADAFPFAASLAVTRMAPADGVPNVATAAYTHVTTQRDSRTYEWANLVVLNNASDAGANVSLYAQAYKSGYGPTSAGTVQLHDGVGRGGFFGLEIDATSRGASPVPGSQDGDRIGMGIILGRAHGTGPKATIDYGIWIAPAGRDDKEADVNFGMMVFAQCRFACFAMRAGNKIAWEATGQIAGKFDADAGRWGLFNGARPLFEVDVNTGELRVNGRAIAVSEKAVRSE